MPIIKQKIGNDFTTEPYQFYVVVEEKQLRPGSHIEGTIVRSDGEKGSQFKELQISVPDSDSMKIITAENFNGPGSNERREGGEQQKITTLLRGPQINEYFEREMRQFEGGHMYERGKINKEIKLLWRDGK